MMSCLRRIGYKVPRDLSLVIPGPNIGCAASNESVMTPIGLMNPIAPSLPKPVSRFLANTHTNINRGSVYFFGFKLDFEKVATGASVDDRPAFYDCGMPIASWEWGKVFE